MALFKTKRILSFLIVALLVILIFLTTGCQSIKTVMQATKVLRLEVAPEVTPNTVLYRYRFGGEIVAHYLDDVESVTTYKRSGADRYDQVVFNLKNGWDYVLNEDVLVDYELFPGSQIEEYQELNKLYHHYDPYLQGYKQDKHKMWVNDQYLNWAGRLPTEEEWLEALNELTRGVEHHQMEHWIAYSPPAVENYIKIHVGDVLKCEPTSKEKIHIFGLLLGGMQYEVFESSLTD